MASIELEWRNYLLQNGIIESQNEAKKRDHILTILRSLLPSFVQSSAQENNTSGNVDCQLVPFGSFALGGHLLNGDIDVVLLAPSSVRRRDFFGFFTKLLKNQPMIREVEPIPRATVPIIKCVIDSIPIDISFVRFHCMETIPDDIDLLDDSILRGLEISCLASTDGPRVGRYISRHIRSNEMPAFRLALQCIKHWSNRRYIYGKPMGYLNGGSWTLLLLKTYLCLQSQSTSSTSLASPSSTDTSSKCHIQIPPSQPVTATQSTSKFYGGLSKTSSSSSSSSPVPISPTLSTAPSHTPTPTKAAPLLSKPISFISLLRHFFEMWSTWPWPKPVILTQHIPTNIGTINDDMDSIDDLDCIGSSLLPICTPCYPVSSAAPFVTRSTRSILTNELTRANQILQYDPSGIKQDSMAKLFKPLRIIKSYKHFIKITVTCETIGNHDMWSRRIPNSIPRLTELLEDITEIKVAHPFTKSYTDYVTYRTRYEKNLLKSGLLLHGEDPHGKLFPGSLYRRFFLIGLDFHDVYKHGNKVVDISEIVKVFSNEMDDKKNRRDSDVNIHISAIKRREAADLIEY